MTISNRNWVRTKRFFKRGHRYKVMNDLVSGGPDGDLFESGETLTFRKAYYAPYDRAFVFVFRARDGQRKSWWVRDDEPISAWREYFRRVGAFDGLPRVFRRH